MQFKEEGTAGTLKLLGPHGYLGKMGHGRIAP